MYEITAEMKTKGDLFAFLDKTQQFSKKFYQCHAGSAYMISEDEGIPILYVSAIAISRDLTYILHWEIPFRKHVEHEQDTTEEKDRASLEAKGKFPIRNAIPYKELDKELFYPYLTMEGSDAPYETIFTGHEFIRVNAIHKDGTPLV